MLSTIDLFRDKWDIYLISCFFSQYPTWKMGTFSIAWICSIWMCISDNDVQCWSQPSEASLDAKNIGMWTRFPWSQRLVGLVPGHWEVYIVALKLFIGGNLIESWKNIVEKVLKCIGMGIRSKVIFTGLAPSTSSCCPSPLLATFLKRQSRF